MRPIITPILAIGLVIVSFLIGQKLAGSKKLPPAKAEKGNPTAFVINVQNQPVPVQITESGKLMAKKRIDLYAEVQGVMLGSDREFKAGVKFNKGDVLVRIKDTDHYANLQAQKSNLQNLITAILPDLKLDYPEAYKKWDAYLKNFDMSKPVAQLPEPTTDKEKFFITGKNIYTTYYNTKNLEIILGKYTIRAPFDGVLTEAMVNQGGLIRNGQKLGEFIQPNVYELEIALNKEWIKSVTVGNTVQVFNPETNEAYEGKVIRINSKLNPNTQTQQGFIALSGAGLSEGVYLEAQINGNAKENAITVNRSLLVDDNKLYMVKDSALALITANIVHKSEKRVVVNNIPDHTQLLTQSVPGAYPGMPVNVKLK
jgi:multidrug efflux pump subunit AcrA (membrane-fusion protein)